MLSTLDQLTIDRETNTFDNYKPWTTRYGAELTNIDDAINFLLFHEGLHTGVIMAIAKLVTK